MIADDRRKKEIRYVCSHLRRGALRRRGAADNVTQQGAQRAQTTLVNIQQENDTLRKLVADANNRIDEITAQNDELSSQAEADAARIASLDAIASAGMHIINGKYSLAREQLDLVDTEILTEDELAAYERMYKRVH